MTNGVVKFFQSRKGYGFIIAEDEQEVFVHYTSIQAEEGEFKTLYQGDKVEFEIVEEERGPQAKNVVVIERAPRQRKSDY